MEDINFEHYKTCAGGFSNFNTRFSYEITKLPTWCTRELIRQHSEHVITVCYANT